MSAQEIIEEIKDLPPAERAQVARFVVENDAALIGQELQQAIKNGDADWSRMTAEQFLKGYAPGDAIYDKE